jgi:hypothetical protein
VDKIEQKRLISNLIEATVPFGRVTPDFEHINEIEDESKKPNLVNPLSTLISAQKEIKINRTRRICQYILNRV